jgi:iron(III) transport system permease protein
VVRAATDAALDVVRAALNLPMRAPGALLVVGLIALVMIAPAVVVLGRPVSNATMAAVGAPLWASAILATLTAVTAGALGLLAAWSIERITPRFRGGVLVVLSLPLVLPSYLMGLAWAPVLSPTGLIVRPIGPSAMIEWPALLSVAWVLSLAFGGVVLWMLRLRRAQWAVSYDEAADVLALSPRASRALRVRWYGPSWLIAALIVWLLALADFAVADYYGVRTQTAEVFAHVAATLDLAGAARGASVLLALSVIPIAAMVWLLRGSPLVAHSRANVTADVRREPARATARERAVATLCVALLLLVIAVIPATLLLRAMADGATGAAKTLAAAFALAREDLAGSVVLGASAALMTAVLGAALTGAMRALRAEKMVRAGVAITFVWPVAVWGVGFALIASQWLEAAHYTTMFVLLALALSLRALSPALEILAARRRDVPRGWIEAAHLHRVPYAQFGIRLLWPWMRPAVLLALAWGALWAINDVALVVLLAPAGFSTLMLRIYQTVHYGPPELLAALALIQILLALAVTGAVWLALRLMRVRLPRMPQQS